MTRAKAEKIKRGIDNKIRKTTVDMEWWAYVWGFTVDEYEEFLDLATEALEQERPEIIRCKNCRHDNNCEIQFDAQAGSEFFCGSAERRE